MRALGRLPAMGVPESFVKRHPFPGPGLAVRVLGDVTASDHLDVLREARAALGVLLEPCPAGLVSLLLHCRACSRHVLAGHQALRSAA